MKRPTFLACGRKGAVNNHPTQAALDALGPRHAGTLDGHTRPAAPAAARRHPSERLRPCPSHRAAARSPLVVGGSGANGAGPPTGDRPQLSMRGGEAEHPRGATCDADPFAVAVWVRLGRIPAPP